MRIKITAIVLGVVRHSDTRSVATLYTPDRGRLTCVVPVAQRRGRSSRVPLLPLSIIEADINFRPAQQLQMLSSYSPARVWRSIYVNPAKMAVATFISEFLMRLLRDSQPDAPTWTFIERSLMLLDSAGSGTEHSLRGRHAVANFHLVFTASLASFAGIQPDLTHYSPDAPFDMLSGTYLPPAAINRTGMGYGLNATGTKKGMVAGNDTHLLMPPAAALPRMLARLSYSTAARLPLSGETRYRILEGILRYYSYHFPGMSTLRSHHILREVFA